MKRQRELDRWDCVAIMLFRSSQGHGILESTGTQKQLMSMRSKIGVQYFLEKCSCATMKCQSKLDRWDCVATSLFMSSQEHDMLESRSQQAMNNNCQCEMPKMGNCPFFKKISSTNIKQSRVYGQVVLCGQSPLQQPPCPPRGRAIKKTQGELCFYLLWAPKHIGKICSPNMNMADKKMVSRVGGDHNSQVQYQVRTLE